MKKLVQNISVLIMVCLLLVGTGGLNIYHYCCDACEEYGHQIFNTITCEEVHSHHHCSDHHCSHDSHSNDVVSDNVDDICSHLVAHAKHCDVHHMDVFSDFTPDSQNISVDVPLFSFVLFEVGNKVDTQITLYNNFLSSISDAPPLSDGRSIIVRKNSYLI